MKTNCNYTVPKGSFRGESDIYKEKKQLIDAVRDDKPIVISSSNTNMVPQSDSKGRTMPGVVTSRSTFN